MLKMPPSSRDLAIQSLQIAVDQLMNTLEDIPTHDIEYIVTEIEETLPLPRAEEGI